MIKYFFKIKKHKLNENFEKYTKTTITKLFPLIIKVGFPPLIFVQIPSKFLSFADKDEVDESVEDDKMDRYMIKK